MLNKLLKKVFNNKKQFLNILFKSTFTIFISLQIETSFLATNLSAFRAVAAAALAAATSHDTELKKKEGIGKTARIFSLFPPPLNFCPRIVQRQVQNRTEQKHLQQQQQQNKVGEKIPKANKAFPHSLFLYSCSHKHIFTELVRTSLDK